MSQFQNELESLQQQQKEVLEKLQTAEQESLRCRELALKLQGAIEVLTSLGGQAEQDAPAVTPEVVED